MKMRSLPVFVITVGTQFGLARAQETPAKTPAPKFMTTYDMRQEAGKELEAAEAELDAVLKKLQSLLYEEGQKTRLQASQAAWLNYRKLNSDFEAFFWDGGSGQPQIHLRSIALMTRTRTKELQRIIDENLVH